jgi:DeoR/GlpR family transcriptional regulator of sugar metabolism
MAETRKQRLTQLLNTVRMEKSTSIDELARIFSVSTATIRRDIKELEKYASVVQTVGGGVLYNIDHNGAMYPARVGRAISEKIRIAEYCTELVRDYDDILITPGTTTFLVGKIMSGISDRRFRIITNSLELAVETSAAENIRTVILGGEVWNKHSVGVDSGSEYFATCHSQHTLIMSADGVDRAHGVTVFESQVVPMLKQMMDVSTRIVLAVDSSKLGCARYNQVASWEDVSMIVTDDAADREDVAFYRDHGVEVVLV